jgi:hypothetical protein
MYMMNPELNLHINPLETSDEDCTACRQPYGTNPLCANCRKGMTPEDIKERLAKMDEDSKMLKRKRSK